MPLLPGVPHASFLNPYNLQSEPRESIEVVVVIYILVLVCNFLSSGAHFSTSYPRLTTGSTYS